jgi:hypothetical protein
LNPADYPVHDARKKGDSGVWRPGGRAKNRRKLYEAFFFNRARTLELRQYFVIGDPLFFFVDRSLPCVA